jgi:hypothetical protein
MRILSYKSEIVKLQLDAAPIKNRRFYDSDGALRAILDLPVLTFTDSAS